MGLVCIVNFLLGLVVGLITRDNFVKKHREFVEKDTYCHGFEDGIYYAIGEYNPEFFRLEAAENSYREYKTLKHGVEKH